MATTVFDVAAYIVAKRGSMSPMKLQKLVYYSQAWSLAWTGVPLFIERIEAWRDGPVVPALYQVHRKLSIVDGLDRGDASRLSLTQLETVDSVLSYYGTRSGKELSDLTHGEPPWLRARQGLHFWQAGNREIGHTELLNYYKSIDQQSNS